MAGFLVMTVQQNRQIILSCSLKILASHQWWFLMTNIPGLGNTWPKKVAKLPHWGRNSQMQLPLQLRSPTASSDLHPRESTVRVVTLPLLCASI